THLSKNFFVDETQSIDSATVFNDGASVPAQTDGYLTSTKLTGLGMGNGIAYGNLENLDVKLGQHDDAFTVQSTAKGTATKIEGHGGNDLVNVGSSAATNNGNLDNIQGPLTIIGGVYPDPFFDQIYVNDYAKSGRANYLVTPDRLVNYVLPSTFVPVIPTP